jgi:hypothetical protein
MRGANFASRRVVYTLEHLPIFAPLPLSAGTDLSDLLELNGFAFQADNSEEIP